jgi:hypothetical protein
VKIEKISISVEYKDTKDYNSARHGITLSAIVESTDDYKKVEEALYQECQRFLKEVAGNSNASQTQANTNNQPQPTEAQKDDGNAEQQTEAVCTTEEKPKSDEEVMVEDLIEQLNIRSPKYANFLRAQNRISYDQWKAVTEYFNQH